MPQFANITVNNFAATGVTYSVEDVRNGIAKWNDTAQGTPAGFRPISLEVRRSSDRSNGADKVFIKISRPVVNATTGAVDYTSRVNIDVSIPTRATLSERQELYAMLKNFAAHANCQSAIKDLEGTY